MPKSKKKGSGGLLILAAGVGAAAVVGGAVLLSRANPSPRIMMTFGPQSGPAPLTVTFSGSSVDPYGSPLPYSTLYLFVVGGPLVNPVTSFQTDSTGAFSTSYMITNPGTYTVFVADNIQGV